MQGTLQHIKVAERRPVLAATGLAVEHFPVYRHPESLAQHTHDIIEFCLMISGRAWSRVGQVTTPFEPGMISVITWGQSHDIVTDESGANLFNLYLDPARQAIPDLPEKLAAWLAPVLPLHRSFLHRQNQIILLPASRPAELATILKLMETEQIEQRPGWQEAMRQAFSLFLIECARSVCQMAELGRDSFGLAAAGARLAVSPMEGLRQALDRHPNRDWRLADCAKDLGLSVGHFCRSFKNHTGQSLVSYLHQRRIERALFLLRTTRRKVVDIAQDCGFADLSQFNRLFRSLTGQTPRQCRDISPV